MAGAQRAEAIGVTDVDKDLKILVADEFATTRRIVRNLLADLGFKSLEEAGDGDKALAMLREGRYDLLLCDWNLPGMSGLELLKAVRANPELNRLPVLMVTADASREQIIAAGKAGVGGLMAKPFTAQALKKKLQTLLESKESAA